MRRLWRYLKSRGSLGMNRCKNMQIKDLDTVTILGMGLLGGSIGLAVNRVMPKVRRVGYSHRQVTRDKAVAAGTIDEAFASVGEAVASAQLVILASPMGIRNYA